MPGRIISIEALNDTAFRNGRVSFSGIIKEVNLSLVPDAVEGDYVLVHVGLAISKVDETEAKLTFEYLRQMGELDEIKTSAE
ncbi:MAG TPA: HypC/HybG/HupF family hydrogenase formation chaperone [Chitinophagaceae bacterium]